jgi:hypothetical protein
MDREKIEQKLESDVNELDLSRDEDLSIGLMNLISLEEHLFFTHEKTGNERHLEMLSEIRRIRTDAMEEIVSDTEGEEWCISKHLLSASMRFRETGDKMLDRDREKAKQFYDKAFSLYSMFWAVNFDLNSSDSEETGINPDKETIDKEPENDRSKEDESSWLDSVKDTVKSAVDCCREI